MNTVIIKEENIEEFQWMSAVVEETVSTSNGEKSQVLSKSQKGEFSKNNTHIPFGSCIDSESGKKKNASKKKRKDKKAKDRVKMPLNAFMLYMKEKRAVANSTIYKNSSLSKLWHELTDEQRAVYNAQACEERRRHALLHPSQPRLRKRRPSGFFRKCRAEYGMDSQHLWCANCRRKQKCLWLLNAPALSKDSGEKNDSSSTISKAGFFKKCRAKYGMDSQHLWCANCRRKKKCLWLLKALAEENGGVLPKLPPRRKKPSKDSGEKNDSSSTISKADINFEKCRQKDNTELGNQETEPRPRRKARADTEYKRYVRQVKNMTQSCFVLDGQHENAKTCFELNAKDDDAKSCLEMNAKQDDAKSCFEKNVKQDTELDDNGIEFQIESYKLKNEIEDFVPHTVKLEIIEFEETKIGGISGCSG